MKRLITAVSLTLFAAPLFAAEVGAPYEQTQFDRTLPNVESTQAQASGSYAEDHNFIAPAK